MSDMRTRQEMLSAAGRDTEALESALADLRRAVQRPFTIGTRVREHIGAHPVSWIAAALLAGIWLGRGVMWRGTQVGIRD
jgi:hypothetical protein